MSSEIALYTELEHYVDDELECVNNKDMEKLLEVLQQKQGVISRQELLQEEWGQIAMKFVLLKGAMALYFGRLWNNMSSLKGFIPFLK